MGPDGAPNKQLETIALMSAQPNMPVVAPCDVEEARKATLAAAVSGGPMYLRFARSKSPIFTTAETPFEIGVAIVLWDGDIPEATIIACGSLLYNALTAANELQKEGVNVVVLNNHTIKPMDIDAVVVLAKKTGAIVTVEEHQITGGLGGAVAELLAKNLPTPMEFIGMQNTFGESGDPDELIEKYGMGVNSITNAVKKVLKRK